MSEHRFLQSTKSWIMFMIVMALCTVMFFYWRADKVSNFYLIDAEPRNPHHLADLQSLKEKQDSEPSGHTSFGFSVHQIKAGQGIILAHRRFSHGSLGADDESYEKLTIWLPQPFPAISKQSRQLPTKGNVWFSSGSSAWPKLDCSGYINGVIKLTKADKDIQVNITGIFQPQGNFEPDACQRHPFSFDFLARQTELTRLTAWNGGGGVTTA